MSFPQQTSPDCGAWLLTDGHAGNVRQAEALARALGVAAAAPCLEPAAPWRWLAPRRLPGAERGFGPAFAASLERPVPSLAIGCGRQGALATRLLRARGARAVQILDPRLDTRHWDLVIAPEHDGLHGANVIPLLGSLNPVDADWLADGAARFPALLALPRPRIVVLVGGPTRQAPWNVAALEALLGRLRRRVLADGGSLLATVSRRTPGDAVASLRENLGGVPGLLWDGAGTNPYAGLLACADRLVCTPDSVNMLSEASATTAPVFVLEPHCVRGRLGTFLQALQARDRIRGTDDPDLPPFTVTALRETARIADEVRRRLCPEIPVPAPA